MLIKKFKKAVVGTDGVLFQWDETLLGKNCLQEEKTPNDSWELWKILTLSCITLKNGQTYFKNLAEKGQMHKRVTKKSNETNQSKVH